MFNRPDERRDLLHFIKRGFSILMLAPRRIGKTWLLKKFAEDLAAHGWMTVLCDVEGIADPGGFLRHLCDQLQRQNSTVTKFKDRVTHVMGQIFAKDASETLQAALLRLEWSSFAETLVRGLHESGQPTVILVDELTLFVNDLAGREPETARAFLYRLRALAQAYPKVQWFFTGSIGLDVIAKREGIGGALLDLKIFPIEPFSPEAARGFLDHLTLNGQVLRPFRLGDDGFAALVDELGWLAPFYLELIAHEIRPSGPADVTGRKLAMPDDVEAAFQSLLSVQRRNYFVAWEEHIDKNFNDFEAAALSRILAVCARQPGGESWNTLVAHFNRPPDAVQPKVLRDFLSVLAADGYLTESVDAGGPRYRFRSGLLRRYWLRYHAE